MLIARQKEIVIGGRVVRLYSLDEKLWFSNPHDLKAFKQRRARRFAAVQNSFGAYDARRLPTLTPYSWMGFDR
jgi:hypothetical protein